MHIIYPFKPDSYHPPDPRSVDPCAADHAFLADSAGGLHHVQLEPSTGAATPLQSFELHFAAGPGLPASRVAAPWASFEMLAGMPGEFVFAKKGSNKLLYGSLPPAPSVQTGVFLFGAHAGAARCVHPYTSGLSFAILLSTDLLCFVGPL